jgi:FKBP-type peptidyl-prolyl cis-trans isomerase 2
VIDKKIVFFILAIALSMGCVTEEIVETSTTTSTVPQIKAERGDTVYVNYIGRLTNGTIFDTSYEKTAREAGVYTITREYKPLEFTIGKNMVIPGFEDAVEGMTVGEEKTVRVPPKWAYGEPDPEKVIEVNRTQSFPRFLDISLERFIEESGEEPYVGLTYSVDLYEWNKTVVNLTNSTVTVRLDPWPNASAHTNFGLADVEVNEENVYITANPVEGMMVYTDAGPGRVLDVTEDSITMDFNHWLSGKTLIFDLKLEDITKGR